MPVVVRCSGCGGLARVGPEAVGLLVVCPRCHVPFLADPVPEPAVPAPPPPPPPPRPTRAVPVAAPRRVAEPPDHPPPAPGGVPFSVIIGLALLPLAIPMLWLIGPAAVGTAPALTLATPVSLAIAASALCLAVAYTVDWSPVTRIKGVLILVGLAVFAGMSLYFLKRDWAEWLQTRLGGADWHYVEADDGSYSVELPAQPQELQRAANPVPVLRSLTGFQATVVKGNRAGTYVVAAGPDPDPDAEDDDWFAAVAKSVRESGRGWAVGAGRPLGGLTLANREWTAEAGRQVLTVRVLRDPANRRVFLLAVEAGRGKARDDDVRRFFESFRHAGDDD